MVLFKTVKNIDGLADAPENTANLTTKFPEIVIYHLEQQLQQTISTMLGLAGYHHCAISDKQHLPQRQRQPIPVLITGVNPDKSRLPPHRQLISVSPICEGIAKSKLANNFIIPLQNEELLLKIDSLLYQKTGKVIQISPLQGGAGATTVAFCLANLFQEYLRPVSSVAQKPQTKLRIAVLTADRFSPWLGKLGGVQIRLSDEIAKSSDRVLSRKIETLAGQYSGISHFFYATTPTQNTIAFIDSLRKIYHLILVDIGKNSLPLAKQKIWVAKPEVQSYQYLRELTPKRALLVWNNPLRSRKHWILPPVENNTNTRRSFLIPHCKKLFYASQQNLDIPLPSAIKRPLQSLKKEIINECFSS